MRSTQPEAQTQTDAMSEAQTEPQRNNAPPLISTHLRRLVLTGFMGAGKSTIGRLLAARLNWSFLDLDAHLVEGKRGAS
jgi:shikimate kinase